MKKKEQENTFSTYNCQNATSYYQLVDQFNEQSVASSIDNLIAQKLQEQALSYQEKKELWNQFGYYLAIHPNNIFIKKELEQMQNTKDDYQKIYNCKKHKFFTLEEEKKSGFDLLCRPYLNDILINNDLATLDIYTILASIKDIDCYNFVIAKLHYIVTNLSSSINEANSLRQFLKYVESLPLRADISDLSLINQFFKNQLPDYFSQDKLLEKRTLMNALEMYIRYQTAREKFFAYNYRLVSSVAYNFDAENGILELEDLIQEGVIGLNRAIERFDILYGVHFSTFAYPNITQAITKSIAKTARTIRLPYYLRGLLSKISQNNTELTIKLGRTPTIEELADSLNLSPDRLTEILTDDFITQCDSFKTKIRDGVDFEVVCLKDIVNNTIPMEDNYIYKEALHHIKDLMTRVLTEKEQTILLKRSGVNRDEPMNLIDIGKEYHCTRENIRQIENKALKKLRRTRYFNDYNPFV